jgi:chromosome segregation ATPase
VSAQELDTMAAQLRAATEARDAARVTTANLRAQIAGMTQRYSGMEAEHKAWAEQRGKHAQRKQASDQRSQTERARLSEEILSLRAEVSRHLSARAAATTEAEALALRLRDAEADAASAREALAVLRDTHASEPDRARTEMRELRLQKMDLAGDVASLSTQLAACRTERDALDKGATKTRKELRAARQQLQEEAEAAKAQLSLSVKAERETARASMARAERAWGAKECELREAATLAEETGRQALQEARDGAMLELEKERAAREAERTAATTERNILIRTQAEKMQALKDAHREAMRVAAQEATRSLSRIREVDERVVDLEQAAARARRDTEDAEKRAEATRAAGELAVGKVEELLEETRGMYTVSNKDREVLRTAVQRLESELQDAQKREQLLSDSLADAEGVAAEVPVLKTSLASLQEIEVERDAALKEK